jgi:hypothetical protein
MSPLATSTIKPTSTGAALESNLSEYLFSTAASWKAVASEPLLKDQITLLMPANGPATLQWVAKNATAIKAGNPTTIELLVPTQELDSLTGWNFKAGILTNYFATKADSCKEPLRSPFLQSLMSRKFELTSITNTSLTDAKLTPTFAPKVLMTDVRLNASFEFKCTELYLKNVEIKDCQIEFNVGRGSWQGVVVDGYTSRLSGTLGQTTLDKECRFNKVHVAVDLTAATIQDPNNARNMLGPESVYAADLMPEAIKKHLGTPLSPEQLQALQDRIAAGKWNTVPNAAWRSSNDCSSIQSSGAGSQVSAKRVDE